MKTEHSSEVPDAPRITAERQRRADLRRAIIFGVVMATIQMAVLLYFVYG